jgi:DNA polymerase III alpha subunit
LNDTYGIPIYQEQIMALLAEFCEVDLDETNKMRKIIGIPASKKKPEHWEYIDSQKEIFLKNAGARIGDLLAWQWWEAAVGSLSYGFNRSHSVAYAMVAFRQLFLKKYFPKEFYCALLQTEHAASNANKKSKLMQFIIEAKHLGVPIESPHIDKSKRELDYHGDVIFIGFEQIKGVGGKAVDHIIERGPYTSFQDFIDKHAKGTGSKVSKTVIEALLYTDAFRDFGSRQDHLRTLYYHNLLKTVKKDPEKLQAAWDAYEEPTRFDLLKKEHDLLTTVLSEDDPLDLPFGYKRITEAIDSPKDRVCKLKGIVESKQTLTAKSSGNKYIRMTINDLENSCTVLIWRNQFGMVYDAVEGSIIQIEATHKDGDTFFLKRCIKIENEE